MIRAYAAASVRAAEEPLLRAGPPGALMGHAAFALATEVMRQIRSRGARVPGTRVLVLAGGGNNGGDALHAAALLARRGAAVTAAVLTPAPHAEGASAARASGVRLVPIDAPAALGSLGAIAREAAVWIDGLAGIGVQGGLREPLAGAVLALEALRRGLLRPPLVVAVDTPSGIGVDDGVVPGPVLAADLTVTMGACKPGLLLPPSDRLAGRVVVVDIGLGPGLRDVVADVARLTGDDVASLWPVPGAGAQKYTRGVLGLVAGSPRYPGAGVLAAAGASSAGLGMIRYLGDGAVLAAVRSAHPEVVGAPGRVQAWVLGPGIDPADRPATAGLAAALGSAFAEGLPTVLDAGALALLWPDHPDAVDGVLSPAVVLTPHAGELAQVLTARGVTADDGPVERRHVEAAPARWARRAAVATGATVLLKGATTVVAAPTGPLYAQADATPWLATAGAGDVLAGVLGALLAGRSDDVRADAALAPRLAAAAALVHGRAARRAAGYPSAGPIAAGDVARALPATVAEILEGGALEGRVLGGSVRGGSRRAGRAGDGRTGAGRAGDRDA